MNGSMKTIDREELFQQVSSFLKTKGIELQEGSYVRTIQKGCQVLADTINLSQQAMDRAKTSVGKKLDEVRNVIHEKTAPKPPPVTPNPPRTGPSEPPPAAKGASGRKGRPGKTTGTTPRRPRRKG